MNINRNNYEEYFLLYADNELSNTEKKVVEIFLQENIDLKEEFYMIQLTVNAPEKDIKLADKSFLLKNVTAPFITEENYEYIFVLYHDGELSELQKAETEIFLKQHPKYKEEFELTGKAKLVPDLSIVFKDKKQLYRKEHSGRIIPLILWRSLAAAVLIGFGLWIIVPYVNKNNRHHTVTTSDNVATNNPVVSKTDSSVKNSGDHKKTADQKNNIASVTELQQVKKEKKENSFEKRKDIIRPDMHKEQIAKNNTEIANSPQQTPAIKELTPEVNKREITANVPEKIIPQNQEKKYEVPTQEITAQIIKTPQEVENPAHPRYTSFAENTEPQNENYVFYDVSTEEFRKSKVGGFLKKVTRIVKRTNPISHLFGDNEEQVAAK